MTRNHASALIEFRRRSSISDLNNLISLSTVASDTMSAALSTRSSLKSVGRVQA